MLTCFPPWGRSLRIMQLLLSAHPAAQKAEQFFECFCVSRVPEERPFTTHCDEVFIFQLFKGVRKGRARDSYSLPISPTTPSAARATGRLSLAK
jgi:hypothetical protein